MKFVFKDAQGASQEVDLGLDVYKEAADKRMSVPQFINSTYETDSEKYGTVFDQLAASAGLFQKADSTYGVKPPTLKEVVDGTASLNAAAVTRDAQPGSRYLFPAVVLEAIESKLRYDAGGYVGMFESMVAMRDDIQGPRFEQPVINYARIGTNNKDVARSQQIGQLSLPNGMLSITTSDVARTIPTFSIGLEISDQALQATSLPLVTMAVTRQAELERIARVDEYIQQYMWGNRDMAMGDLSSRAVKARTLDGSIASGAAGTVLTHQAWVKWLNRDFRTRALNWGLCTVNTALAVEGRTGRPNYPAQDGDAKLIRPMPKIANPQYADLNLMLVEDGVLPDGVVLGLDSRYAIRVVRNAQAEYSAVESFVMKRSQAMRFDFAETSYRMYDTAFDVLMLGDTSFPADPR